MEPLFKVIRRWKGPKRVRFFLWKGAKDSLVTNAMRIRGMLDNASCPLCLGSPKNIDHVFHLCELGKNVWSHCFPLTIIWMLLIWISDHGF